AIDDFGTGYSSLSYLHKFAVDRIKIDQSFIRNISKTVANQAIVRAIMALGNSLNIEMIAEGVESMAELEAIKLFDCQEIQGYLISRPIPANELNVWFQNYVKQYH
ncbi:EAL domain-containing protein, partial [Methylicorpusculum sp.]|uniref:EAL domain-containing protein n=2 Tax=Methylicorpusculum sp. TaxID=2713644 RepID=UPI002AB82770